MRYDTRYQVPPPKYYATVSGERLLRINWYRLIWPVTDDKTGNKHVLVLIERNSRLTEALQLRPTTSGNVSQAFVNQMVMPYGIPKSLLSGNGPQFVSKFCASVGTIMGVKQITTTGYYAHTNGQT